MDITLDDIRSGNRPGGEQPVLRFPERFNFGYDVVDWRARERDKTAMVAVGRDGQTVTTYRFSDIAAASNRVANALDDLGCAGGERAYVMMARVPAWLEVMVGCIKSGIVAMPATTLLGPKDIEYRVNRSGATLAIVSAENAPKIDAVLARCPGLRHLIIVGGQREGWLSYDDLTAAASLHRPFTAQR